MKKMQELRASSHEEGDTPLLTVIVPVYNVAPYLRRCLDSIGNQTYRRLEILCVNDGSTDEGPVILAEYAARDKRFVVLSQPNSGQAAARNVALKHASGDYVTMVDADDYVEPDLCERLMEGVALGADLSVCSTFVDGTESQYHRDMQECLRVKWSGYQELTDENVALVPVHATSKLFRMSLIRRYGIEYLSGRWHEDYGFCVKYLSVCRSCYGETRCLYHYVQRDDSTMGLVRNGHIKFLDYIDVIEDFYAFLKRHGRWGQCLGLMKFTFGTLGYVWGESGKGIKRVAERRIARLVKDWRLRGMIPSCSHDQIFQLKSTTGKVWSCLCAAFYRRTPSKRVYSILWLPVLRIVRRGKVTQWKVLGLTLLKREHSAEEE